ncbi:MAG: DUF2798 domain-containing protein [Lachnospiraceae bacterium]|nr:DUF2798 domain-containing protein [Lachnospiraceae bacterium]
MPKNRLQETIFTIMMVIVMVYGMVFYNITIAKGAFSTGTFLEVFAELPLMCLIAFVIDTLIAGPVAQKLSKTIVASRTSKPIFMVLAISIFSIMLMCPMMSFSATLIHHGGLNADTLANWGRAILINLPMAFGWQLLVAGPIVRKIFGTIVAKHTVNA